MGQLVNVDHDGVHLSGYLAEPAGTPTAGLIVIQEWWGLNDWVKDQARALAKEGYVALAVDLYRGKVTANPDEVFKNGFE